MPKVNVVEGDMLGVTTCETELLRVPDCDRVVVEI